MKRRQILPLSMIAIASMIANATTTTADAADFRSPEVHADGRVTFRFHAPGADEVKLTGQIAPKGGAPLQKDEGGVWSATLGPLEPDIYAYMFSVDGAAVTDPRNGEVKVWRTLNSLVEVPSRDGQEPPPWQYRAGIPHGATHYHRYASQSLGVERGLLIYTPPGYDAKRAEPYPVLYLLHGSGDNERAWVDVGKADRIADALIAAGKAEQMIIAMPYGHVPDSLPGGAKPDWLRSTNEGFTKDLVGDVLPFVEANYRAAAGDPAKRAVAGLSMGGGEAIWAVLHHPDLFAYAGAFSSAAPQGGDWPPAKEGAPAFNGQVKLFWIACGKDDFLFDRNNKFIAELEKRGVGHEYKVSEGGHDWQVWRRYLSELAPRLFR